MRRLPKSLPEPVRALLRWLDAADVPPLAPDLVPGANETERRRLAALGAVVPLIAPNATSTWPDQLTAWVDSAVALDPPPVDADDLLNDSDSDLLAMTYEWVVNGTNRRRLGTFFTPASLVDHMLRLSVELLGRRPAAVADPGAGVGAFSVAALRRWPVTEVAAVDVNAVTLGLLSARLEARHSDAATRLHLVSSDYLPWLTRDDGWGAFNGPRLILGNPPYTRHQHMTSKEKQQAQEAAGDLITSGLAGLSAYFLAASLQALRDDDALCLLLPGSWCETRYGRDIRAWLWNQTHRRVSVELFTSELEVFPGTQVTAMVLGVGPMKRTVQPFTVLDSTLCSTGVVVRKTVYMGRDAACPATFTGVLRDPTPHRDGTVPLGDYARIRRGVATGATEFFFLTDADRTTHKLPKAALRPALVKPRHSRSEVLTPETHQQIGDAGRPRWLLDLNNTDLADTNPHVAAYLQRGIEKQIHLRHLPRHRPHWYAVEPVEAPDLFLVPVGKDTHRIITNEIRAVGSNNLYGIYLNDDAPWTVDQFATWLRSDTAQRALRQLARHYQGGSLKLEPKSLRGLMVPRRASR